MRIKRIDAARQGAQKGDRGKGYDTTEARNSCRFFILTSAVQEFSNFNIRDAVQRKGIVDSDDEMARQRNGTKRRDNLGDE